MKPDSSRNVIDRVVEWLRGFLAAGKGAADSATRDARGTARESVDDVTRRIHRGRDQQDTGGQPRSDFDDQRAASTTSSFTTTTVPGAATTTPTARDPGLAGEPTDEEIDHRSDFDDAPGDWETGEETYPSGQADLASATHVHDAVGGEDERADDSTDGIIDTTRDADLAPGGTEGYQGREVSLQDELIVGEGASSDEFDGGEITVGDVDTSDVSRADVEAAAEGYGDTTDTSLDETTDAGTSTLTGSTFTETDITVPPSGPGERSTDTGGASADQGSSAENASAELARQDGGGQEASGPGGFHVVERYNYGMGDLGVGAGTTPGDAWSGDTAPDVTTADIHTGVDADLNDASAPTTGPAATGGFTESSVETPADAVSGTPGDIDASVSPDATRTEIESQSRGDAINRSDDATQTPGFGAPETFGDVETGTTEPSRSATGDELDERKDALGTTLDYGAESSDAFDEDVANLSAEDELTITDEDVDYGPEGGETVERVATFQSGTIAHEGLIREDTTAMDPEVTAEAYADLADEPRHETADDTGLDDFSGSDYPSDRRVDVLAGDDFTDAETPDVLDLDSSAGDLDVTSTDAADQIDYVTEPVEQTVGDAGSRLDQDMLASTDQTVGEDVADLTESASMEVSEAGAQTLTGTGTAGAAHTPSGATVGESAPAGAVRGDGTTEAPAGYPVKGNASSMIYHLPDFPSYAGTKAEYHFATEQDAIAAGYRAPGNVRRGGSGSDDANVASETQTGVVTAADATGESADSATYRPAGAVSEATGTNSGQRGTGARDDTGSVAEVPAGAVRGDGTTGTPDGYPVKGNASSKIYHLPGFPSYASTKAEYCFATEQDAINAGYRAPGKRNRGRKS